MKLPTFDPISQKYSASVFQNWLTKNIPELAQDTFYVFMFVVAVIIGMTE